jgi:arginine decarboxylase
MSTVRVACGSGTAPTAMAAYDTALAAADAHDYNLVTVSSVVPADATVTVVDSLPDLGQAGDRLTVVQSRATREPGADAPGVAGLGWALSADGPGVLYEASGTDVEAVRTEVQAGLDHAVGLRDWAVVDSDVVAEAVEPSPADHACAVALAALGRGEGIP